MSLNISDIHYSRLIRMKIEVTTTEHTDVFPFSSHAHVVGLIRQYSNHLKRTDSHWDSEQTTTAHTFWMPHELTPGTTS